MTCRLCGASSCSVYCHTMNRTYYHCSICDLIFVPDGECPSRDKQLERYAFHHNTLDDAGYISYLQKVASELDHIPIKNPVVLDFGSGGEKVLTKILRERGIDAAAYDPLYGIACSLQAATYDIVVLCEVIEHLGDLASEIALLRQVIRPEGFFLIHTGLMSPSVNFTEWWYVKDVTHINFFSMHTMAYIGSLLGKKIHYTNGTNTVILG